MSTSYLGQSPVFGDFPFQILSGDGTAVYTLNFKSSGTNGVLVFLNGAVQRPGFDFSVIGDQLTFQANVSIGVQIFVYGMGLPKSSLAPSQGSIAFAQLDADVQNKFTSRITRKESTTVQSISGSTVGPEIYTPLSFSDTLESGLYMITGKLQLNVNGAGMGGSNSVSGILRNGTTVLDVSSFNIVSEAYTGYSASFVWSGELDGLVDINVAFAKSSTVGGLTVNGDRDNTTDNITGQKSCIEIYRIS